MTASPPPIPSRPAARRSFVKVMSLLALAALSLPGAFLGYHWWLASKIERRLAVVRSAGEPVTLAELNQYYPEVAAVSNAAPAYGRAFESLKKTKSFKFLEKFDGLPDGSDPLPAALREKMETACQENAATFEALAEAVKLKSCRYPVDYTPGLAALLPHISHLRKCSSLQVCRGAIAEQDGRMDEVMDALRAILHFAASLDAEPDLISVLVQLRLDYDAAELLRWVMNHRQLSPQQLQAAREMVEGTDRTSRLGRALVGERCYILAVFSRSPGEILNVIEPDPDYEGRLWAVLGMRALQVSGILKKDEIRFLQRVDQCQEVLQLPLSAGLKRATELRFEVSQEAVPKKFILTGMLFPSLLKGVEKNGGAVALHRLLLTALSVEQYRIEEKHVPDSLAALHPHYMELISMDPFSEQPIQYRRELQGYTIYSLGPDRVDDGGTNSVPRDPKASAAKKDIIFRVFR